MVFYITNNEVSNGEQEVMNLSRILTLTLALVLVLTASLAQAAPAAAAGTVPNTSARAPAFGGLLGDLFSFIIELGNWLGSLFGGGGGSKGGGSPHNPGKPGQKDPPWNWDNDWDGKGYKSSYDLWKKWYC